MEGSPGMTGAGGFNPHKRPPQQAPSQQAIPNANEAQDASVQGQQIPEIYARVTQQQGYQPLVQPQLSYPDHTLSPEGINSMRTAHYASSPNHTAMRPQNYPFQQGPIQQGMQRKMAPQMQQVLPGHAQPLQRPMVASQQPYIRMQPANQQVRPINAQMQQPYQQQQMMQNTSVPKHNMLQNSPKALLGTLIQQVPAEHQTQFLNLYSKLQSKQIGSEEFLARAKEMLVMGKANRMGVNAQKNVQQPILVEPQPSVLPQVQQQVDPKVQQNLQNGFQRVTPTQPQIPRFQQAQPTISGYNPYQYVIPQNYPDINFQQQHMQPKQPPQNPRHPPFQKSPSGLGSPGIGDGVQVPPRMVQGNNDDLITGQEYSSSHNANQPPGAPTSMVNDGGPAAAQSYSGLFPYHLSQMQMQNHIYNQDSLLPEATPQVYSVYTQKAKKLQKVKQQKQPLAPILHKDPVIPLVQQAPAPQPPSATALATKRQQIFTAKQAPNDTVAKKDPEATQPSAPPKPSLLPKQHKPTQHQAQPKERDPSKLDMQSMIDVTSYTSINLKQEEENIINAIIPNYDNLGITFSTSDTDKTEVDSFLNFDALGLRLDTIARVNGLRFTDKRLMSFISIAVKSLIRGLLEKMSVASKHRVGITHKKLVTSERGSKDSGSGYVLDFNIVITDDIKESLAKIKGNELKMENELRERLGLPLIAPELLEEEPPPEEQASLDAEQKEGASNPANPADPALAPEDQASISIPGGNVASTASSSAADNPLSAQGPSRRKKKASKIRDLPEVIKVRNTNEVIMAAVGGAPLKSWMTTASNAAFNFLNKSNTKDSSTNSKDDAKSKLITVVPLKRKAEEQDDVDSTKQDDTDKKGINTQSCKDENQAGDVSEVQKADTAPCSLPEIPSDSKFWPKIGISSDKTRIPGGVNTGTPKDADADDEEHNITLEDALFCIQMQRNFCKSSILHKWLMR